MTGVSFLPLSIAAGTGRTVATLTRQFGSCDTYPNGYNP